MHTHINTNTNTRTKYTHECERLGRDAADPTWNVGAANKNNSCIYGQRPSVGSLHDPPLLATPSPHPPTSNNDTPATAAAATATAPVATARTPATGVPIDAPTRAGLPRQCVRSCLGEKEFPRGWGRWGRMWPRCALGHVCSGYVCRRSA